MGKTGVDEIPGTQEIIAERKRALGSWRRGEINAVIAFSVTGVLWIGPGVLALVLGTDHRVVTAVTTSVPAAGAALVAGAKQLASLKSLSFTLTAEEGGEPLMAGLEAAKIEGDVVLPDQLTLQITEPDGEP